MLWLCLSFPRLPLSALGLDDALAVVADQRGSQRWLIASATDVAAGTSLSAAFAANPQLTVHARKPEAERAALAGLAHWLYRYGNPVAAEIIDLQEVGRCPRARLWVEAGASLKLFGGFAQLRRRLLAELIDFGHDAQHALAPTRAGAALLAEAGAQEIYPDRESLQTGLAELPLRALPWPGTVLNALTGVGLRQIGELFELPRASFAHRFGEAWLTELDRMRGFAPEPFEALTPPPRYGRRFELAGEIETVEPLLFPLKRLCAELAAYLRARDAGVCAVALECAHAIGPPTVLTLRFLAPTRDAARLFAALNERLLRQPPAQPVRELLLTAEEFATPKPLQGDLFDGVGGQTLEWEQALERVLARFGEGALWTPAGVADHRPEFAFKKSAPNTPGTTLPAARPAWLLAQPRPIAAPASVAQAERIESGWWDGRDCARDYYAVERDGARAWVFQDRTTQRWYLHGFFA